MSWFMSVFFNIGAIVVCVFGDMDQERIYTGFWALLIMGAIWGSKGVANEK